MWNNTQPMQQPQQQQQQALPVDFRYANQPPCNLSLQSPPCVPQYAGPQQIQAIMPMISAACAMEIQGMAIPTARNILRVFMYNLCSQNCWNNQHFAEVVLLSADMISVALLSGRAGNLQAVVEEVIVKVCETMAAIQPMRYQALIPNLDQSWQQIIQGHAQQFQTMTNTIAQAKNGNAQAQPQQNNWGGGHNSWSNQQQPQQAGTNWAGLPVRATPNVVGVGGSSGMFSGGGYQAPNNSSAPAPSYERHGNYSAPEQPAIEQPVVVEEVVNKPIIEPAHQSTLKWAPTAEQPYPPAYNPRKVTLMYQYDPEKNHVTATLAPKDPNVDIKRHTLPTAFNSFPAHYTNENAIAACARLGSAVTDLKKEQEAVREKPETPTVLVRKEMFDCGSLDDLWTEGMIARARVASSGILPGVYRFSGEINRALVSYKPDEKKWIEKFGESFSYAELREKLVGLRQTVSGELWTLANRRATELVNHILAKNLSLAGVSIDDFSEDYPDLLPYLEKKYGDLLAKSFLKDETLNIRKLFKTPSDQTTQILQTMLLGDEPFEEDSAPTISFISTRYTMALINSTVFNLEMELNPAVGNALTENQTPELRRLAAAIFDDIKEEDMIAHCYIRTADGHVLELTKGYVGTGIYLISLVS